MRTAARLTAYMLAACLCLSLALAAWLYPPASAGTVTDAMPSPCLSALEEMAASGDGKRSNCEVRLWYEQQLGVLPDLDDRLMARQTPVEARALCAYEVRRQARLQARMQMDSTLDVMRLRLRDLLKYGHPDGPGFDQLLRVNGDKANPYEAIVASARQVRPNLVSGCDQAASE